MDVELLVEDLVAGQSFLLRFQQIYLLQLVECCDLFGLYSQVLMHGFGSP